jgi:tetratricopeptide (TPR) repeat protein
LSHDIASGALRVVPEPASDLHLYKLHSKAMAQLAIGTCVVIASLLAIPDGVALIPRSTDLVSWMLGIIGVWISVAVLWFVFFLGILHCVAFLVKGVEVTEDGIRLWRLARPIPWDRIEALGVEPQYFFSKIFSLSPVALKLTVFEHKTAWRKNAEPHLVPHFLPSFLFAPEDFKSLIADITKNKFDFVPDAFDVVVAQQPTFVRLKSVYGMLGWQRILLSILIAFGLVSMLGRKAIVNYQYNSGNKAMRAHNYPAAREMYETASIVDPTFAAAWNNLGNAEFVLGDFKNAETHWQRAVFYKPDFVEAKISLAYFALQKRDFPKAKDLIDTALMLDPLNAAGLTMRADYALRLGHVHNAINDARQVIADDPKRSGDNRFTAACIFAQGRLRQGNVFEADKILREFAPVPNPLAKNGQNISYRLLISSQVDRALDRLEDAQLQIERAVQRAPLSGEILVEKANVEKSLKQYVSAATTLNAAQKIAPDNPWVYIVRAQLIQSQSNRNVPITQDAGLGHGGQSKESAQIEKQLALASLCPNQDAESLAQIAYLYLQFGDRKDARSSAENSTKIESNTPVALFVLHKTAAE